jgi:ADP-ribose pyrophosphatase YjhB (NUDIX family)
VADRKVLLVRYEDVSGYDGEQGWFLPDDYLHHLEHPQHAAQRILKEQTGLEVPGLDIVSIESFEGHGSWHLIFHYCAQLPSLPHATRGRNVRSLEWFALDKLPAPDQVAHGGWALETLQSHLSRG